MYEIEVRHGGLNKYRLIRGRDRWVVEQKAEAQLAQWDDQWDRFLIAEEKRQIAAEKRLQREQLAADREEKKAEAFERTRHAEAELEAALGILEATLSVDDAIDWSALKNHTSFNEPKPRRASVSSAPPEPDPSHYEAKLGLLGFLFPAVRKSRQEKAAAALEDARSSWCSAKAAHAAELEQAERAKHEAVAAWEERKLAYEREQVANNASIDELEAAHNEGRRDAVEEHADLVLTQSSYPDWFNRDWELSYQAATNILIVNYLLPTLEDVPNLKEVKYIQTRDEFDDKLITQAQLKRNYDSIVYQICLRTLHELFEADRESQNLNAITFNGITEFLSPETGKMTSSCICSIQVTAGEFEEINLEAVEPKACFKALKGVAASSLSQMAPVAPLMVLDRDDSRFVESEDVASKIAEGENIAAMDWQDFEHLIRQLFEAEYSSEGCEVRVTQGSRDGGVDAIAFDPDPIRGGQVVIQAKRYTNTVAVAAVRDLYGTVVNEGATKGILVTTAQFGPDARKFAAGKPLALIDGPNLLHMLAQHGTKARIDLAEAKLILA